MKKHMKRYLALAITFALIIAVPFTAFTQEASAASKKTKYVVTSQTRTRTDENGKPVTETVKYQYDKNGLSKAVIYQDGDKRTYTRNKKGYVTTTKYYDTKGQLDSVTNYTYKYDKKGNAVQQTVINVNGGVKTVEGTYKMTNYKNGKVKKEVYTSADGSISSTTTYNKKGDWTGWINKGTNYLYVDKFTYKYDKKNNPVKCVDTYTMQESGETSSSAITTTYKYKYDKHKNITTAVITRIYSDGSTDTETLTYKYKKVKVPKKFLKFFR